MMRVTKLKPMGDSQDYIATMGPYSRFIRITGFVSNDPAVAKRELDYQIAAARKMLSRL